MTTMNQRMVRVFTILSVGFMALIGMLTWWQIVVAGELKQKDSNQQSAYYEQRIARGFISTSDGVRLATRRATAGANGETVYTRAYPQGNLAAHVLGYDTRGNARAGVEKALNTELTGSDRNLGAVVGLLDGSDQVVGDNVQLTIDAAAQRVAQEQLSGLTGAIVALEPATGRVLVSASSPTFTSQEAITDFAGIQKRDASLFNRATQSGYAPGSTFKLVTTAAALANGRTPDTKFPRTTEYRNIKNFDREVAPAGTLSDALTNSYNTVFAKLGNDLGAERLRTQMEQFGFFETPPLVGLPNDELRASGLSDTDGSPLELNDDVDTARVAIGQERLTVTPLQMAMVAAAIGNDGKLVKPSLVEQVTRANGGQVRGFEVRDWKQSMTPAHARQLQRMMQNVVEEGTGSAVRLQGIQIAGKTGTADFGGRNLVWFVAFAPVDNPRVAIAVAIENQASGQTGGDVAAPKAREVLRRLLERAPS
ncbi:MAG: penicillin-binding protein 2 [Thermoleophilia bacterium]|nr:penicillin-binding protein 2 [Thermoleophilia bacterium]